MGGVQAHTRRGVQAHTWGGGFQAHTWEGVSRSTPRGGQAQGGVCIPACTEANTPPSRQLPLRAVRILLECILVWECVGTYTVHAQARLAQCAHMLSMHTLTL